MIASVFAFEGAGEGSAGDKFRVSGTKEMAEGAGANKESGARVRSKLHPLRNFELHKRKRPTFSSTSSTDLTLIAIICAGENCSAGIKGQRSLSQELFGVSVCLEDRSPATGPANNST